MNEFLYCIRPSFCIANCAPWLQRLVCVDHPALCAIYHRSTRIPTNITLLNMFIVHILPRKLLVAAPATKPLLDVNGGNVAVDRIFKHCFTGSAALPQTLYHAAGITLCMPFPDVSTDTGSGANDPQPAGIAGLGPLTLVDADYTTSLTCTGGEIIVVDPQPIDVDCRSTSATPATWVLLLWGAIEHDRGLHLVIDSVCTTFGRARGR